MVPQRMSRSTETRGQERDVHGVHVELLNELVIYVREEVGMNMNCMFLGVQCHHFHIDLFRKEIGLVLEGHGSLLVQRPKRNRSRRQSVPCLTKSLDLKFFMWF